MDSVCSREAARTRPSPRGRSASPELAKIIDAELAAYNNLQDIVGLTFYGWAVTIGLAPPDNSLFLPFIK